MVIITRYILIIVKIKFFLTSCAETRKCSPFGFVFPWKNNSLSNCYELRSLVPLFDHPAQLRVHDRPAPLIVVRYPARFCPDVTLIAPPPPFIKLWPLELSLLLHTRRVSISTRRRCHRRGSPSKKGRECRARNPPGSCEALSLLSRASFLFEIML